jgi:hypothetical protein
VCGDAGGEKAETEKAEAEKDSGVEGAEAEAEVDSAELLEKAEADVGVGNEFLPLDSAGSTRTAS